MKETKKSIKENRIIEAAEKVFATVGFKNAKMEDIAGEAGITKVTLYAYFQSKENLYMAVTYKALQLLINNYYQTIDEYKTKPGLDCTVALIETFMSFCEDNFLYSETLLDYFALMRSIRNDKDATKLTDALKESFYYMKLQDIHNLPFKLTAKEITRGKEDGSISPSVDPMFHTLHGWTQCVGYAKVIAASGANAMPLFSVNLRELKSLSLNIARKLLSTDVFRKEFIDMPS